MQHPKGEKKRPHLSKASRSERQELAQAGTAAETSADAPAEPSTASTQSNVHSEQQTPSAAATSARFIQTVPEAHARMDETEDRPLLRRSPEQETRSQPLPVRDIQTQGDEKEKPERESEHQPHQREPQLEQTSPGPMPRLDRVGPQPRPEPQPGSARPGFAGQPIERVAWLEAREPTLPFASAQYASQLGGAPISKMDFAYPELTSPRGVHRTVAVSTEPVLSETTILLDVNPYVRYPLVVLNLLLWLVGLVLILVGAYAYMETWDQPSMAAFGYTSNIYSVLVVNLEATVVLLGLTLLSLSFCGCVGALRENTCLLLTYSYFITALLLLNLALGVLVFFLPTQLKRMLRSTLTRNLVVHYRDSADLQRLIDSVQVELQCCGISQKDFRDWNDNMYFNCSRSNPSSERCSVPYSCCKKNSSEQVVSLYCGQGVLNQTDYDAWFKIYTGNCVDAGHRFVRENVTLITGLCLVFVILLAFVQMVTQALVDEIIIIRRIYDRFYDRVFELRAADVTD